MIKIYTNSQYIFPKAKTKNVVKVEQTLQKFQGEPFLQSALDFT